MLLHSTTPYTLDIKRHQLGYIQSVCMPRPSNFHAHFRRDALMRAVSESIMRHVLYVLAMPNNGALKDTVVRTVTEAIEYHEDLMYIAEKAGFHWLKILMTLYHTADITPEVIEEIARSAVVYAVKDYPSHKGATTGSGYGIPLEDHPDMLHAMEETGVPLLGHFEDVYDKHGKMLPHNMREQHCVRNRLWRLRDKHPDLRICCEHATTREMVEFVKADKSGKTVMTVTPMPLLFTDKDFAKSWGNLLKCMPITKGEPHQRAVLDFATSGDFRCIAGNDDAPHPSKTKLVAFDECSFGCSLPHSVPLYAKAFNQAGALDHRFINFMCLNGPNWWGLPLPSLDDTVTIRHDTAHDIPDPIDIVEEDGSISDIVLPLGFSLEPDRLQVGLAM